MHCIRGHVPLVSFHLDQFLSLSLCFMTLMFSETLGLFFIGCPRIWVWHFLMLDAGFAFLVGILPQWSCVLGAPWQEAQDVSLSRSWWLFGEEEICLVPALRTYSFPLCSYVSCTEIFWNNVNTLLLLYGFPNHLFLLSSRMVLGMSLATMVL